MLLRLLCAFLALVAAPGTQPHTALERRRSQMLFQTAAALAIAGGTRAFWRSQGYIMARGSSRQQEVVDLMLAAAAEPFLRRHVFVPGQLRFTFARLESLLHRGEFGPADTVLNAFQSTRFRLEDLPRLLSGLRVPAEFVTRHNHRFLGEEGLLVMLTRLAYPGLHAP